MINKNTIAVRGFTLIETFVAIAILATALAGALSLASQGFNANIAPDQITASFLAQDAIEYVRFARDTNCLVDGVTKQCNGSLWLTNMNAGGINLVNCISGNSSSLKYCYFDSSLTANSLSCATAGVPTSCPAMQFDSTSGLYNYVGLSSGAIPNRAVSASNAPSKFTRAVSILTPVAGNSNEAQIIVETWWTGRAGAGSCTVGGQRNCIILQENIFNWEP